MKLFAKYQTTKNHTNQSEFFCDNHKQMEVFKLQSHWPYSKNKDYNRFIFPSKKHLFTETKLSIEQESNLRSLLEVNHHNSPSLMQPTLMQPNESVVASKWRGVLHRKLYNRKCQSENHFRRTKGKTKGFKFQRYLYHHSFLSQHSEISHNIC